MSNQRLLEGKYALVTGGSRGIGRAAVEALSGAGCNVAVTSRHLADAEEAAREARSHHGVEVLAAPCDVSDLENVKTLFTEICRWSSDRLDVVICNAGFVFDREIWDTPLHETPPQKLAAWYEGVFRTDTMGSLFCTYHALPLMMAARSGSIVYVASIPALEGLQGSPYTVAKAGILGLMKDVACMYGKYNIRANALALGSILTPATLEVLDQEVQRAYAAEAALKRWGRVEEAAQAMLFLASTQSSFITGQTLVVDGGIVRR